MSFEKILQGWMGEDQVEKSQGQKEQHVQSYECNVKPPRTSPITSASWYSCPWRVPSNTGGKKKRPTCVIYKICVIPKAIKNTMGSALCHLGFYTVE